MRPRLLRNKVGAGVLALAGAVTPAAAQGDPSTSLRLPADTTFVRAARPIIVLESYVGQRPGNAGAIIERLLTELEARGFAVRPAGILPRIGGLAPRPGTRDKGKTAAEAAAEIRQLADTGFAAYTRGRFAEAELVLALALDQVHHNPALLVLDTNNLKVTFKILVGLALSQAKRGDISGSVATMMELIRTFRNQPITRAGYGPEAEQLYRAAYKQVQVMGRGELSITVDNDQAVIFVDGQIRGLGKATLDDLMPGVYRVFVQVSPLAGRQYEIEVSADRRAALHVDWDLDSSLWVGESWIGFVFTTEAERTKQAGFAGRLARRWGDGDPLAVVSLVQVHGMPGVIGSMYDAAGSVLRSAVVTLDGDELRLRLLARFLAGGTAGVGVHVVHDAALRTGHPEDADAAPAGVRSPLGSQLLIGAGAAALVAGGVLYAIDQDPGPAAPYLYRNTASAGVAVGTVGIAAVSMGLWLWSARSRRLSAPTFAIGPTGGFIGWAGEL